MIPNRIIRALRRVTGTNRQKLTDIHPRKVSYAQCGEDIIVKLVLDALRIEKPTYLDLGAFDPVALSNTYLFYTLGCSGVCVEPDPVCFDRLKRKRSRDTCLNVGVGVEANSEADFYVMSEATLNTFSEEEATRIDTTTSYKIVRKTKVPLITVSQIIEQHFAAAPNFVSMDIEGLDLAILKSFDFERWRPQTFCVETAQFSEHSSQAVKLDEIITFMEQQNYFVYADTFLNTIFVDKAAWKDDKTG